MRTALIAVLAAIAVVVGLTGIGFAQHWGGNGGWMGGYGHHWNYGGPGNSNNWGGQGWGHMGRGHGMWGNGMWGHHMWGPGHHWNNWGYGPDYDPTDDVD